MYWGESSVTADTGIKELSKANQRKLDSSHLREPLTELANEEIRFTEDSRSLKFLTVINSITANCARPTKFAPGR